MLSFVKFPVAAFQESVRYYCKTIVSFTSFISIKGVQAQAEAHQGRSSGRHPGEPEVAEERHSTLDVFSLWKYKRYVVQ